MADVKFTPRKESAAAIQVTQPVTPAPPPVLSKVEEELAAGRAALAAHAAHMALVRPPEDNKPANVIVELDRLAVPGMNAKGPTVTKVG